MKEPKRYYCGNGEGMFEDDKNGYWVEYSEHKAIVDELTERLRKHAVSGRNEQLNDFADWLERNWFEYSDRDSRYWVKEFLEGKGI